MAQHETVERLAGDAARLQTQYEQRGQARQSVSRLRSACGAWLQSGVPGHCRLANYHGPAPSLAKDKTL